MTIRVERGGPQTTLQAAPRRGLRHLGVPAAGAADPLSLALANRLVGNPAQAAGLEMTLSGPSLRFAAPARIAVTGAAMELRLNDETCPHHATVRVRPGDRLDVGACPSGARAYLAVAGGLAAVPVLGSVSTYLPAGLGGLAGRALAAGDRLDVAERPAADEALRTPDAYRPPVPRAWALRVCRGAEARRLDAAAWDALTGLAWTVGRRADRMGLELAGPPLSVDSAGRMPSAAVFPGTLQCPEGGTPFLLGVDAQTTGGYPRALQVARCDRHLLGQLRPGDRVRFLLRDPEAAAADLRAKHAYWRRWLPDVGDVI